MTPLETGVDPACGQTHDDALTGESAEDAEQQLAVRRGGVYLLGERAKGDADSLLDRYTAASVAPLAWLPQVTRVWRWPWCSASTSRRCVTPAWP